MCKCESERSQRCSHPVNDQLSRTPDLISFLICHSNSLLLWSQYVLILYSSTTHQGETWEMPRRSLLKMIGDEEHLLLFCLPASCHAKPLPFHFWDSPWSFQKIKKKHLACSWSCFSRSANIMPFCLHVLALDDL